MICVICGRDINAIFQDNMSPIFGCPVCEDCANDMTDKDWRELEEEMAGVSE